jgi:dCTP deaminase
MVLTDREIQTAIQTKQISIEPRPDQAAFSSTSLDLTLSPRLQVWRTKHAAGVEGNVICPAAQGYNFQDVVKAHSDKLDIGNDGYIVEPGAFILGWTNEDIDLPTSSRIAARVEGKSSLARLGIGIHITAPTIHAGFQGTIQLEICNHGSVRVRLMAGMPVCQLIFEQTFGTPAKGYDGQFFKQKQN